LISTSGDVYCRAKRIKKSFPEAKIIIILRNQADLLVSIYYFLGGPPPKGTPWKGDFISLNDWIDLHLRHPDELINKLDFYNTIEFYRTLFSEKNVGVFLFEQLTENPKAFAGAISQFMDIDQKESEQLISLESHNVTTKFSQLWLMRKKYLPGISFSRITPGPLYRAVTNFLKQEMKNTKIRKDKLNERNYDTLCSLYGVSNRKLAKRLNLPLKKYGYY